MRLPLALLALALANTAPSAQEVLTGTYHYGRIGAEHRAACGQGSGLVTTADTGTITFFPNGTVTMSGTEHVSCSGGATQIGAPGLPLPGVTPLYTLDDSGALVIDYDPVAAPGTLTETLRVSWDRRILVGQNVVAGAPGMLIATLQGNGVSEGDLVGNWTLFELVQDRQPLVEGRSETGPIQLMTGGTTLRTVDWRQMDACTWTTGTNVNVPGSFAVAANGALTLDGSWTGGVTDDGRLGFAIETQGSRTGLRLLLRLPAQPVTPLAVDGAWWAAEYFIEADALGFCTGPTPPPWSVGTECSSCVGMAAFDGALGVLAHSGPCAWVNLFGGGTGEESGSDTFVLHSTGEVDLGPAGAPFAETGWLGRGEDILITSALNDPGYLQALLLIRGWGPLEGSPDELSLAAGGKQTLRLRAGQANAGRLYLVLGSLSGTYPGLPTAGGLVPLNFDAYTQLTLQAPNTPPLTSSLGSLDVLGGGYAFFDLPVGANPMFAGTTAHHAFALLDPTDPNLVVFASNATALDLLP